MLRRDRPLALAPGLCGCDKEGTKMVTRRARGKGKEYLPHLLIAVKPPMRKPSEMSNSGFVILNRTMAR